MLLLLLSFLFKVILLFSFSFVDESLNLFIIISLATSSNNSFIPVPFKAETILEEPLIDFAYKLASSLVTFASVYLSFLFPTIKKWTFVTSVVSFISSYNFFKLLKVSWTVMS